MDKVAAASVAGGVSEEEAASRVEEAVAAAQAEADESMTDLLECLGQEEAKVERLRWVAADVIQARCRRWLTWYAVGQGERGGTMSGTSDCSSAALASA